jgi:hypothetical protein
MQSARGPAPFSRRVWAKLVADPRASQMFLQLLTRQRLVKSVSSHSWQGCRITKSLISVLNAVDLMKPLVLALRLRMVRPSVVQAYPTPQQPHLKSRVAHRLHRLAWFDRLEVAAQFDDILWKLLTATIQGSADSRGGDLTGPRRAAETQFDPPRMEGGEGAEPFRDQECASAIVRKASSVSLGTLGTPHFEKFAPVAARPSPIVSDNGNWRDQLKREEAAGRNARWGRHPRLRHMVSPMANPMASAAADRMPAVVTRAARRRQFSEAGRRLIVEETCRPGQSLSTGQSGIP